MNAQPSADDMQELWQTQPSHAEPFALNDVRRVAKFAGKRLLWMNALAYVGTAITISAFVFYIWHFKEAGVKVGSVGVILALLYALFQHQKWLGPQTLLKDVGNTGCAVALLRELERIGYYHNHSWKLWRGPIYASSVLFLVAVSFESWARAMAPWSWLMHGFVALLLLGMALRNARSYARRTAAFNQGVEAVRKLLNQEAEQRSSS